MIIALNTAKKDELFQKAPQSLLEALYSCLAYSVTKIDDKTSSVIFFDDASKQVLRACTLETSDETDVIRNDQFKKELADVSKEYIANAMAVLNSGIGYAFAQYVRGLSDEDILKLKPVKPTPPTYIPASVTLRGDLSVYEPIFHQEIKEILGNQITLSAGSFYSLSIASRDICTLINPSELVIPNIQSYHHEMTGIKIDRSVPFTPLITGLFLMMKDVGDVHFDCRASTDDFLDRMTSDDGAIHMLSVIHWLPDQPGTYTLEIRVQDRLVECQRRQVTCYLFTLKKI